ncbi:hypothetical protein LOC68_04415 [Blastopirellula sp. JC732]|uniref:Methyltransferase domain-containing protein n=1 Tax=Blastopirellula sediminis TaxID=2894196 RepID=A0A9X1SFK6_9BACT|nr:hypothetical protein [Blastopirellula sediminis]MCC9609598.1 hypothetical protein [Blastopirellula sediminis]MCC9627626.1 hypothetical protein [Blastopirellula sediminis]
MIEFVLRNVASAFGYELTKRYRSKLRAPIPQGAKLYVGCGEDKQEGYFGSDIRPLPHVHLACKAWEVSQFCTGLGEIYSRHTLEHLTLAELKVTLQDWHKALAEGGQVRIEVPNLAFAIAQWQRATWTAEAFEDRYSDACWGFAGLFGWQRECDPTTPEYNQSYWDVHKSGFTADSMRFFLTQAGFDEIEISFDRFTDKQIARRKIHPNASDDCHLIAMARKPRAVQQDTTTAGRRTATAA